MSKWPEIDDRDWPSDLPFEYRVTLQRGRGETLMAKAMVAVVLGLMRRVDELENRIKSIPINWS